MKEKNGYIYVLMGCKKLAYNQPEPALKVVYGKTEPREKAVQWFLSVDPHYFNYYSWSPYHAMACNPILIIDPDGRDWFESAKTGSVIWIDDDSETWEYSYEDDEGNQQTETFANIGEKYTITSSDESSLLHYNQNELVGITDLTSDEGKKYSMLAAEGGWITEEGETKRETQYGLHIIAASMENRLKYPDFFPNTGTYESLFDPDQYNAARSSTYKNLPSKFSQWTSWYGTEDVMDYLDAVYNAAHGNSVAVLKHQYGFSNADKILGYAHNNSTLFGSYTINLTFQKGKTLIKTVQSSTTVFPGLK